MYSLDVAACGGYCVDIYYGVLQVVYIYIYIQGTENEPFPAECPSRFAHFAAPVEALENFLWTST
jgi:hypothetical protein